MNDESRYILAARQYKMFEDVENDGGETNKSTIYIYVYIIFIYIYTLIYTYI